MTDGQAVYLRKLYTDLRRPQKALVIRTDLSLKMIGNPVHQKLTKHIRVQFHYVRELVANGEVAFGVRHDKSDGGR